MGCRPAAQSRPSREGLTDRPLTRAIAGCHFRIWGVAALVGQRKRYGTWGYLAAAGAEAAGFGLSSIAETRSPSGSGPIRGISWPPFWATRRICIARVGGKSVPDTVYSEHEALTLVWGSGKPTANKHQATHKTRSCKHYEYGPVLTLTNVAKSGAEYRIGQLYSHSNTASSVRKCRHRTGGTSLLRL
jgi:hypothetical protein